jgi:hypothetical protein
MAVGLGLLIKISKGGNNAAETKWIEKSRRSLLTEQSLSRPPHLPGEAMMLGVILLVGSQPSKSGAFLLLVAGV